MFIVTSKNPKYSWSTMFFTKKTKNGNEWSNQDTSAKKMSRAQAIMVAAIVRRYTDETVTIVAV